MPSSVDIPFTEGPVNLAWPAIMKTVNDDPYEFFKEGGWGFLASNDAVRENFPFFVHFARLLLTSELRQAEGGSSDESESGSEFAASSDGAASDSASDFGDDDDASASDSGGSDFGDDGDDSGEDWDEMEERVANSEKQKERNGGRARSDSDDDDRKKKGKKGGATKARR